ncbi:7-deoxyloganetin glucosyltransferase-like [Dorcoceras hygrometricum]|uniref:7-deoxyloganetin glucosyltransferase-like n=1 Tax=Dorcoceras hygrometricum TaxID=472368 RepID=A0A2Z7BX31_9LAMI|nr:7-deoxyloganetin glucosyltransferase-like [Dorcoceras hygrometricum]
MHVTYGVESWAVWSLHSRKWEAQLGASSRLSALAEHPHLNPRKLVRLGAQIIRTGHKLREALGVCRLLIWILCSNSCLLQLLTIPTADTSSTAEHTAVSSSVTVESLQQLNIPTFEYFATTACSSTEYIILQKLVFFLNTTANN